MKREGLVVSAKKIKLFQTKIRFLGHDIFQEKIKPINRAIAFANKFPDEIINKKQLQQFLGSLNYITDFYKELTIDVAPFYKRLTKKPTEWTEACTKARQKIKLKGKSPPCLNISDPEALKIVETDASDIGCGGILKKERRERNLSKVCSGYLEPYVKELLCY